MYKIYIENYSRYFPKYKNNIEAAAKLIDTLNLSGCFSDELIKRFWLLVGSSLENRISDEKHDFSKDIENFYNIYEPYCIFSEEFKHSLITLFLTVITKPSGKKK
jgi:hypothetical protein